MKTSCAWCEPLVIDYDVSHGICLPCKDRVWNEALEHHSGGNGERLLGLPGGRKHLHRHDALSLINQVQILDVPELEAVR